MTGGSGVMPQSPVRLTCANGRREHPFYAWAVPSDLRKRANLPPVLYRDRFMVFARATRATISDLRLCTALRVPDRVPDRVPTARHRVPRANGGTRLARGRSAIACQDRALFPQAGASWHAMARVEQAFSETFPYARARSYTCARVHTRARWGTYRSFRASTGHLSTDRAPPPCCSKSLSRKRPDTTSPAEPE